MFRDKVTGDQIKDSDYLARYENQESAKVVAERKVVKAMADAKRIVQAREDSDEVAEFVEDVDEHSLEAFSAHFENECQHSSGLEDAAGSETLADVESAWSRFEDAYSGTWDSETAYVEDMIDSGCFGNVDENSLLQNYIDIESLTRDMFMCDMTAIQTGRGSEVHVYHNY